MAIKLFDSELKVMEVLWREGDVPAKRLAEVLGGQIGWSKTTTYTVIKRCLEKGAIERQEPGFVCRAAVSMDEAREYETNELINRMYGGAADQLVASILGQGKLTAGEIAQLRQLVDRLDGRGACGSAAPRFLRERVL